MWVKLDDRMATHPKCKRAGLEALGFLIAVLCHCNQYETDGVIDDVDLLGAFPVPGMSEAKARELADRLVAVGLLTRVDRGYEVHEYAEHQEQALKVNVQKRRDQARDRKRRSRGHDDVTPTVTRDGPRDSRVTSQRDDQCDTTSDRMRDSRVPRDTHVTAVSRSPVLTSPDQSRPDPSSLRSDGRERAIEQGETAELRMADVHRIFGEERIAAGGSGVGTDIPRTLYEPLLAALGVFRDEAARRSSEPQTLAREAARAFCADAWASKNGRPEKAFLSDPARWLSQERPRRRTDPSPRESFRCVTDEELDDIFGPEKPKEEAKNA